MSSAEDVRIAVAIEEMCKDTPTAERKDTLIQIATAIITNANPNWHGCSAREAVVLAKEILAEVDNPTPEPPPVATTVRRMVNDVRRGYRNLA